MLIAGCRDKPPEPPKVSEALPNLPIPPFATVLSRAGSEDALQIAFRSAVGPDSVARFYRAVLTKAPWSLVGDTRTADGSLALYAEQSGGPPLWVTIRRDTASSGSLVNVGGAVVRSNPDSTPATDSTPPF